MTANDVAQKLTKFIEEHNHKLNKPTYYFITTNFDIIKREPSFIMELYYLYLKNVSNENECEDILQSINDEIQFTFIDKEKRIERLSKYSISKLEDSFRRSIFHSDKIHSVKLGNELIIRDKNKFFDIMYNFALISSDFNKLLKIYFLEEIYDLCETRESKEAVLKNVINYFVKSEHIFVNWGDEKNLKFYSENLDNLYKYVYNKIKEKRYYSVMENLDKIINDISVKDENMSKSKQIILKYIING